MKDTSTLRIFIKANTFRIIVQANTLRIMKDASQHCGLHMLIPESRHHTQFPLQCAALNLCTLENE